MREIYPKGSVKSKDRLKKTRTSWLASKRTVLRLFQKLKKFLRDSPTSEWDAHATCKSLVKLGCLALTDSSLMATSRQGADGKA